LATIIETYSTLPSFAWHVGKDLIVNGRQIYHEIRDAIDQYKSGNWEKFGHDIGEASAKIFLGATEEKLNDQQKRVAGLLQGISKEANFKFDLLELLECIYAEDQAAIALDIGVQSFVKAYKEYKTDQKEAMSDAFGGAIASLAAYQQFKQGLPVCEAAFQNAKYPEFRTANFIRYLNNFSEEDGKAWDTGMTAYEAGDYEKTGEFIAKFFEKIDSQKDKLVAKQLSIDKRHDVTEVIQGFLDGANVGKFNFVELLECIMVADKTLMTAVMDVHMAEDAWKKKDIPEAVATVVALLAIKQGVQQSLQICAQVDKFGPADLSILEKNVTPAALFHPKVQAKISEAFVAYDAGKLYDFGKDVGEAMTLANEKNLFIY